LLFKKNIKDGKITIIRQNVLFAKNKIITKQLSQENYKKIN